MASQRRRAARPRAVRALVTSVIVGGSEKGQSTISLHGEFQGPISAPSPLRSESHLAFIFIRQTPPPQAPRVGPCTPLMLTIYCDQHTAAVGH